MKTILLMITLLSSWAFSMPAYDGEIEFEHADHTTFKGHLVGDEYFSWIEDTHGHVIKYNKHSKNYEYAEIQMVAGKAELQPTGTKVSPHAKPNMVNTLSSSAKSTKETLSQIWQRKKDERKYHH